MHESYTADGVLFVVRSCSKMSKSENMTGEVKSALCDSTGLHGCYLDATSFPLMGFFCCITEENTVYNTNAHGLH